MTQQQITDTLNSLGDVARYELAGYLDNEGIGYALWNGAGYGISDELDKELAKFVNVYKAFADFVSLTNFNEYEITS